MSPTCKSPWEAAEFNLSSHLQLVLEGVEYGFKQQLFFFSSPECLLTSVTTRSRDRPSVICSALTLCCLPRQISSCPLAVLARTVLPGFRVSLCSPRCGFPTSRVLPRRCRCYRSDATPRVLTFSPRRSLSGGSPFGSVRARWPKPEPSRERDTSNHSWSRSTSGTYLSVLQPNPRPGRGSYRHPFPSNKTTRSSAPVFAS
ncbi:PREDICTED: uncharacterized protein LOC106905992 isoform X1 [Poecilia mexicana]|uniref:uncharacterized protein LOC106905992 isoform X1 n=1 Tax=Poecilia mexicana TaxID=48701 RepID=UPI00072EB8FA|nr:PREDICTED: uncharacterized protein LOC106905992 isoform X1 [Poecilia mexicana]